MSEPQNNTRNIPPHDEPSHLNAKKGIFSSIRKTASSVLIAALNYPPSLKERIRKIAIERKNKIKFQIYVKRKLYGKEKVDKKTLSIALALVEKSKTLRPTATVEEILKDSSFVAEIRETIHQTQIDTDGIYRVNHLTDSAQKKFIAKKKYLKQAAKKACEEFLEKCDDERISYDTAIAILNTPAEIDMLIGEAQEEITHNRSGAMRNMGIGFLAGASLLIPQKMYESAFPPDDSKLVKDMSMRVKSIQEDQKKEAEELKKIISRENARREVAALRQEIGKTNPSMTAQREQKLVEEIEALRNENARLKNGQGVAKTPLALLKEGKTVTVPFKGTIVPVKLKSKPQSAQRAQGSHPTL